MSASIDTVLPSESNSGATFLRDARFFFKLGERAVASQMKSQSLWLASLDAESGLRFPSLAFAYWSANRAVQTFERLDVPLASAWLHALHGTKVAQMMASVVEWLAQSVHRPQIPTAHTAAVLTLRQTRDRISKWPADEPLLHVMSRDEFRLGGATLRGVMPVMAEVAAILADGKYDTSSLSLIHGDIHFGNIMTDLNRWWLIDPRGRFPGGGRLFDPYYEWGKIYHECHAQYSNVVRGLLRVEAGDNGLRFRATLEDRAFYVEVERAVAASLARLAPHYGDARIDFNRLALFVGLILLGIVPFHATHPGRPATFVAAGLHALNAFIDAEEENIVLERLPALPFTCAEETALCTPSENGSINSNID